MNMLGRRAFLRSAAGFGAAACFAPLRAAASKIGILCASPKSNL